MKGEKIKVKCHVCGSPHTVDKERYEDWMKGFIPHELGDSADAHMKFLCNSCKSVADVCLSKGTNTDTVELRVSCSKCKHHTDVHIPITKKGG